MISSFHNSLWPQCSAGRTVGDKRQFLAKAAGPAQAAFAPARCGIGWRKPIRHQDRGHRAVQRPIRIVLFLTGLAVAGCTAAPPPQALTSSGAPQPGLAAIETDAQGRCFGRAITPAVIETVTAQELATDAIPGPDGAVLQPARYRSVIRQQIVRDRQEILFETICPPAFTPEFVATLQRALTARGFYRGPITGQLDTATGRAVQDFQRDIGPDSPLLSLGAARALGIVQLSAEQLDAQG